MDGAQPACQLQTGGACFGGLGGLAAYRPLFLALGRGVFLGLLGGLLGAPAE